MNRAERLNAVLDLLAETGQVEVDDIVTKLDVSAATARRDLDTLAAPAAPDAHARRRDRPVRGLRPAHPLQARAARARRSCGSRRRRARSCPAARWSASAAARRAPRSRPCSGRAPTSWSRRRIPTSRSSPTPSTSRPSWSCGPQIKTVVTGGVVHARSYELVGPYSDVVLEKITMDIAFIGVNGIDPLVGATVHDEGEASVNSLMARRATRAVVVADSSKIGRKAFATLGGPEAAEHAHHRRAASPTNSVRRSSSTASR